MGLVNPRDFGQATVRVRWPNPVVVLWRWRYEAAAAAALVQATRTVGLLWTVLFGLFLGAVVALTPARRYAWCVVTAHRVRTACKHLWLHSRTGRLPYVLWTRPVPGGARCTIWCRPGVSAEDVIAVREQFATACWAARVWVDVDPRRTQVVHLFVLRHWDAAAYPPRAR
ncbi:MAG TPA: hypothetical protein VF109_07030 [Mycobacteriales bacterium]